MEGHIYIYGEITSYQGKDAVNYGAINPREVQDQIQANSDAKELTVHVNSPGGDVDAGFAIYDILKASGKTINTRIEGQCYSIATVISLAGKTREATENSEFLIHNPFTIAIGDADDLEKRSEQVRRLENKIAEHYASHTSITAEKALEEMKKDTFMDLAQAKEYGFITEIVETVKAVAYFASNKKRMSDNSEKSILDKIAALFKNQGEESKNLLVKAADGRELEFFERTEGEIQVGDKVSIEGETKTEDVVMANGETYVIKNGVLDSITEKQAEEEETLSVKNLINEAVEASAKVFKQELQKRDQTIQDLKNTIDENQKIFDGLKGIVGDTTVDTKEKKESTSGKVGQQKKSVFFPEGIENLN